MSVSQFIQSENVKLSALKESLNQKLTSRQINFQEHTNSLTDFTSLHSHLHSVTEELVQIANNWRQVQGAVIKHRQDNHKNTVFIENDDYQVEELIKRLKAIEGLPEDLACLQNILNSLNDRTVPLLNSIDQCLYAPLNRQLDETTQMTTNHLSNLESRISSLLH